jgi:error-prone DNA polymerase
LERLEVSVLPKVSPEEGLQESYATVGLSLEAHPVGLVRRELDAEGVTPLARLAWLEHDTVLEVAGLIAHRQRPGTASGVVFLGLEDETGTANVIVWPKLYEAQRSLIRGQPLVRIRGIVQREGGAVSLLAREFRVLTCAPRVHTRSRDFR